MTECDVGQLRDRVTWYRPVRADNANGQAVVDHADAGTTWANVRPAQAGQEADRHAQQMPLLMYEITIRGRTVDVRHDWSCEYRGRTLEVVSVSPNVSGSDWVTVIARERSPSTPG